MFKNLWFLLPILFLFSGYLYSQEINLSSKPTKKLKFSQLDLGLGIDNDHYGQMSLDQIMVFARDPDQMYRDLDGLVEEAKTTNYGTALYVNFGFTPMNQKKGVNNPNREIRVGIGIHSAKEAMVSYKSRTMDTSIVYCNIQSELTLEGAYLFKGEWGKRWHWFLGFGGSGGASFGNEMLIIPGKYFDPGEHPSTQESFEQNKESYGAKQVFYLRGFVVAGLSHEIGKRWLLGFEYRRGAGMQTIQGENPNYIYRTGSFILSAKYRIGSK